MVTKFSEKLKLRARTFAAEDHQKYIMYIVKASGEKTFVTGSTKKELQDFRKRQGQDYKATRIVIAPKKIPRGSPHTMEARKKKWDKRRKK